MSAPHDRDLIKRVHASAARGVLAVTGGGSGAISALLGTPGASRTVLEAVVPYSHQALADWIGGRVESACSEQTARAMAMAAHHRARRLEGHDDWSEDTGRDVFGFGVCAALATDRPKRGDHRLHAAVQTRGATRVWSLKLEKGARSRDAEEQIATHFALTALAKGLGLDAEFAVGPSDELSHREKEAGRVWWEELLWCDGVTALVHPAVNRDDYTDSPRCERVLFPGAFAPPHSGHRRMAEVAEERLGKRVTLELCVRNVDKPGLDLLAIDDRLREIARVFGDREVWLTSRPTFVGKARVLPAIFVVGADTLLRIADPKYYGGDTNLRDNAIAEIADRGCRFLAFGRVADGRFEALEDLALPPRLLAICEGVPESEFRDDISSTLLRRSAEP